MQTDDRQAPSAPLVLLIRYALNQLRAGNGHHAFEDICREYSLQTISKNILPATGPVGAGGDQGRDFETFRSFIRDSAIHGFGAIEPEGLIAFTCTLQQEKLKGKIRSDLSAVMKGSPVSVVYAFCEADLPVARRHELREWAEQTYQVELHVIDGNALARGLARPDTFPIARDRLHIPAHLVPGEASNGLAGPIPVVMPVAAERTATPEVFVGRGEAMSRLLGWLEPASSGGAVVSCVAGLAGAGKTALVRSVARQAVGRGWFPGGAVFVDLHGYDPAGQITAPPVFGPLLRALGLPGDQIPAAVNEQAAVYHRLLATAAADRKSVLLVLDNVSDQRQLAELLPAQRLHRVVMTSRHNLGDPVTALLELDVLPLHEAVELIVLVVRSRDRDGQRAAESSQQLQVLAELCGRLPLALRIVAALLADDEDLTVADLVADLSDPPSRLAGLVHGDVAGAADDDRAAALDRFLSFYRKTTWSACAWVGPQPDHPPDDRFGSREQALTWLDSEKDSLVPTAQAAWRAGRLEDVTGLASHTHAYLELRHHVEEWITLGGLAADASRLLGPNYELPAVTSLGNALRAARRLDESVICQRKALGLAAGLGLRQFEGAVLHNLGLAYFLQGEYAEAEECHRRDLAICAAARDRRGGALSMVALGDALRAQRKFTEAIEVLTKAISALGQCADDRGVMNARSNLALTWLNWRIEGNERAGYVIWLLCQVLKTASLLDDGQAGRIPASTSRPPTGADARAVTRARPATGPARHLSCPAYSVTASWKAMPWSAWVRPRPRAVRTSSRAGPIWWKARLSSRVSAPARRRAGPGSC